MATDERHNALSPEEQVRMEKRRNDVQAYSPPSWSSNYADPVSGQIVEVPMVEHASILHCVLVTI